MADDIVKGLQTISNAALSMQYIVNEAATEIERLRAAGDALAEYLEGVGHDGPAIVLSVWREASRRG